MKKFKVGDTIKFKLFGEWKGVGTYVEHLFGGNRIVVKLTEDFRHDLWKNKGDKLFIFEEEIIH